MNWQRHHDSLAGEAELATQQNASVDIERLSARFHEVYQIEAHRRGDVRHADAYEDLSEATKEWDRVLARYVLENFTPNFTGDPPAPSEEREAGD